MLERAASSSGACGTLPMHKTPDFPNGKRGGKQNETVPTYQREWDFLKGEGPSAQERYHDPLEKPGAFKPGWQAMRRETAIQQDKQRKAQEQIKAERQTAADQHRRDATLQRQLRHGFNPITGQEYNQSTGSWQVESDPWSHQRLQQRPAHVIAAKEAQVASMTAGGVAHSNADKQAGLSKVVEMRRERIANGGLSAAQRSLGGVKELMNWGS